MAEDDGVGEGAAVPVAGGGSRLADAAGLTSGLPHPAVIMAMATSRQKASRFTVVSIDAASPPFSQPAASMSAATLSAESACIPGTACEVS